MWHLFEGLEDENGSAMVEAAMIFPVVMITILVMITFGMVLHDTYVGEMTVRVLAESYGMTDVETMNENAGRRLIMRHDEETVRRHMGGGTRGEAGGEFRINRESRLPFIGKISREDQRIKVERSDPKETVMMVELTRDTLESISMPKAVREMYGRLIGNILTALESY